MLSAVESHLGPSRAYAHPFVGPTVTALVPNCHTISSFPPLNTPPVSMSAAEFARPQPKARYNGSSLSSRSALATSPRSKYMEQTGPVNLAVGSGSASPHSPKMDTLPPPQATPQQPPLMYDAAATFSQPLNYSGIYGRAAASLYGRTGLYPLHHPLAAPPSRAHGTYIAPQLDYHTAPFLPSVPFSPAPTGLPPPPAETPPGASILKKTPTANAFSVPKETKNSVSFKVPSGKEGSLKHRILTRPYSESSKRKSPSRTIPSTVVSTTTVKPNFSRGVLIDLGNGEMRRVEDMRTEDFIASSSKTPGLELVDSTVVKISPAGSDVVVTLNCVKHKSKVHLSVYPEHPFYVYRQGWASCNPEGTLRVHGLKCHQLQVGDVCISLRQKDATPSGVPEIVAVPEAGTREPPNLPSPPVQQQPQNLSRKATQQIEGVTYHPKYRSTSGIASQMDNPPPQSASTTINHSIQSIVMSINDDQRRYQQHFHPLHHTYYNPHEMVPRPDDAAQESKKRRWSAPDNIHEEEGFTGAYPPPHKLASH
ncbi:uncharacterized protein LOC129789017 isoform X2 [Lutzomyia longipalpis]|uniref:uncharacterized protein LOC129789017 isoform X2 n=1 Tax=Lutzomyia longipalpis TaxID=7200 RepID=UPI002483FF52|nr:uncharacterized protein LOC129789017 isoform X2 [Lutzomyia longipalpis]